jgi:ABC-type phosphate transport system substrate-binding protein
MMGMCRRAGRAMAVASIVVVMSLLAPSASSLAETPADIAVAVHLDVPVDALTMAELRRIVLGDREYWPGSVRVTLLIRAPVSHERDVILKTVCLMSEAQFRQHWIAKVFRAETATTPKIAYSPEMAVDLVNRIPGAITFVDAASASRTLKLVKIDGKLPGEPGYPLR